MLRTARLPLWPLLLLLTGCFSPNIWAVAEDGPRIVAVTVPEGPIDGQTSSWTVSWRGGDKPYSIEVMLYPEPGSGEDVNNLSEPVVFTATGVNTPYSFEVVLPQRIDQSGGRVRWGVQIRDAHWTPDSGFGNPFIPAYRPSDSKEGYLDTLPAP